MSVELEATIGSLVWLVIIFVPLERAFPARAQRVFRPAWHTDLAFFAGQHLAFAAIISAILGPAFRFLTSLPALALIRDATAGTPLAVKLVAAWVLGDVLAYFGHRLQHRIDWLWRFHAIHHTAEHLDWLAAHREHPIDTLYTQAIVNLPAVLLGVDFRVALGLVALRSICAIFIHANVRVPLGPLRWIFGAPVLHRWHHARGRDVGNYGNLAPWLDVLFGTHHDPGREPEALGVDEAMPRGYFPLLAAPFRWAHLDLNQERSRYERGALTD